MSYTSGCRRGSLETQETASAYASRWSPLGQESSLTRQPTFLGRLSPFPYSGILGPPLFSMEINFVSGIAAVLAHLAWLDTFWVNEEFCGWRI